MNKEFTQTPEVHALAGMLSATFIQRRDLYPRQLNDGSYVCVRKPLTERHLIAHLRGTMTLGAYLLNADSQTRFAVIDADNDTQLARLANISQSLASDNIPSYLEASRRGGHLWLFFEQPVSGAIVRSFGRSIFKAYDLQSIEFYPKQDELDDGPGSLIRLPFGLHRKNGQRYGFVTPSGEPVATTFAEQIRLLSDPRRVTQAALEDFLAEHQVVMEAPTFSKKEAIGDTPSEQIKRSVTVLEFVGQYVELSPSGRGRCPFHDDRHVSFSVNAKKNYWHCFAGCGGGSIIDFWMKRQGIDFTHAVHELTELLLDK